MNLDQNKATLSLHIGTPAQTNMSFGQEDTPSRGMLMSLPISEIDFFDKTLAVYMMFPATRPSKSPSVLQVFNNLYTLPRDLVKVNMYWHRVVIPVSKSCANSWKKLVITASV